MKKILCLLLVLFLIPTAFVFSACKEDDSYKIANLKTDVLGLADKYAVLVVENENLKFDYSIYKQEDKAKLADCVKNVEPYKNLERYNQVFYNLMDFSFDYVGACSNENFELSADYRNNIKTKLDALESSIKVVDVNTRALAEILHGSEDVTNQIYIERLDTVLTSYNRLFETGAEFNNAVADLYFNKILINSNPNIGLISQDKFETSVVINTLDARSKNAISLLTQNYIEMYVSKSTLVDELMKKDAGGNFGTLDLTINSYGATVNKLRVLDLTKAENLQKAIETSSNQANKETFYQKAIQAYQIQEMVQNDRNSYEKACLDIEYLKVKNDEKANNYEKTCVKVIDNYSYITNQYAGTLAELIAIINV